MQKKQTLKWVALMALLALMLAMVGSGTAASPQAEEPKQLQCGDSVDCSLGTPAVEVINRGVGPAIKGRSAASKTGIRGVGRPGVKGSSGGGNGVEGYSETGYGVYAESDSDDALVAISDNGWAGRFEAENFSAISAAADGSNHYGVAAFADDAYGVWAETDVYGGYGVYTTDQIYTGGGCVGCTSMLIALNGSDETLDPGDVVAVTGVAEGPSEYYARPVLAVRQVDGTSGQGVVGVVEGRYVRELVTQEGGKVVEDAHATTEPAAPGDYLTVVYRGIVQVKVDAAAGAIQVGDLLTSAGASGWAVKAQPATEAGAFLTGTILGKAVEPLAEGQGLIWVLVDLQ
jgi:hypothetical protein